MSHDENKRPRKLCFVTIGATASFDSLISACLEPRFLETLSSAGYSDLLVQYGKDGKALFDKLVAEAEKLKQLGVAIQGFDFNRQGLTEEMRVAKGGPGDSEGVVISHAGSGTILAALRMDVPLIVVPNPDLLDNHQAELAEALEDQGYVVYGRLNNLSAAIAGSEKLRKSHKVWPPVNSGQHRRAKGLAGVMDEEVGFLD
ncbi:glycosyltransferase family 1 protein [Lepidopterella palustris CBS 459.81]|uniref:UDP-N-acetylglucosamine transferase subunit ALG13 n=1 Tax=Lepidopterella palustris CBS 459.81 TaxID=1314670 RepID=A0A8E2JA09_9PEZI|nr:glycosyltransferase family 1 protein [Lepidopterella palustris CBS 459.81]